jgi:NADPH:quinone reductase-like Zn-dependent oxidoreductase
VLINGASGALGTSAIQIAKHPGAYVAEVCSCKNSGLATSLEPDEVIDYQREDFTKSKRLRACPDFHD